MTVEDFSYTMQVLKEKSVSIEVKIDEIKKIKVMMESKRVNRETAVELMDKVIMKLQSEDHNKLEVLIKQLVTAVRQTEENGYSIDAQVETLSSAAKSNGNEVVDVYVDRGISGKSMKGRLELQRLLHDVEEGKFDEAVIWKINCISGRTKDLLEIVDRFDKCNVSFRSFSESFETETAMGKFALSMMGAVGELEHNTIVENVKLGLRERARQGKWNGGRVLGYESVKVSDNPASTETKLVIVPDEAMIVKEIYALYKSGKGLKAIANEINHKGFRTKRGNTFSTSAVKEIIMNPVYCGKIRYNRFEDWCKCQSLNAL